MEMGVVAALPDDVLAGVLRRLPPQSLAVTRSVCKPWRAVVDGHNMLLPALLPRAVRGVLLNYIDHESPHLFSRPSPPPPSTTFPAVDGMFDFIPKKHREWWSVLDHCNGVLLCDMQWTGRLCVCNPATRQWALLPPCAAAKPRRRGSATEGAYIVFDPAMAVSSSPDYEVVTIPAVPEKPKPPECHRIKGRRVPQAQQEEAAPVMEDPCRLMEWPPTPWTMLMFASRIGQWQERSFVREGEPMGVVEDMRSDPSEVTFHGPRQRYAVYSKGVLYVHCRGSFVMRLSLSDDKYQVIKTPANIKHTKPYLGRLGNKVCFGVTYECKLSVWILDESHGQMEWVLKYEDVDLMHIGKHVGQHGRQMNGPWILREESSKAVKSAPTESSEWDSDNDDIFEVDIDVKFYVTNFNILGFHPYKEVVFLAQSFRPVAYHLSCSKVQYLGNARPDCYYHNHTNGVYESFVYTPCMIGQFEQDYIDQLED